MRHTLVAALLSFGVLPLGCSSSNQDSPRSSGGSGNGGGSGGSGATAQGGSGNAAGGGAAGAGGSSGPPACSVQKGSAGTLLRGRLLSASGPMPGELLIDDKGKIACAAPSCASTAGYSTATVIDCGATAVVSPGLINAHDHTDYDAHPPLSFGTTRYDHRNGWRKGTGGETPLPSVTPSTNPNVLAGAELRFVLGGATSINGSGGIAGLARNVAAYKTPTWTEGLGGGTTFFDTFPLGDSDGTELTSGCAYPNIRSATSVISSPAYTPHIAEGINLAAENELSCASQASNDLVTAKTGIIHAVGLNAKDVSSVAKAGAKVIWSPRSNIDLYGNTAPVSELAAAGVTIALGTDWLATGSMNLLRELACADSLNLKYFQQTFSDRDLVEMATKNAALAIGFGNQIGQLDVGYVADVTLFANGGANEYRSIIDAGVEDVLLVLRGGKPLFGDQALVAALASSCDALDVCGISKSVCVDSPGVTLAAIQSAAAGVYPLFFCKNQAPSSEPSCIPYRDSYPNGISATDRDGDGIDDAEDDCPDVFNPPRPMDGTAQADVDGDGSGDACDAAPLDPGKQ